MKRFSLSVVICLSAFFWTAPSYSYLLKDEKNGTQLSIFGLGMLRLNYAFVDGNLVFFEEDEDGFSEGFDHREFLSLTANGVLFHGYTLDGEVYYNDDDDLDEDDDDNEPDWRFHVELSRDESYLLVGDQPNIFEQPYFPRYTQPFRGLTLHLESDKLGVTTFGALTRGTIVKDELIPDGTSGPYTLASIPVVYDSDIVTLEIRNQNDPREIIETIHQERNIDYSIDYNTGEITFARPIDTETFSGDPLVIVVIYRSEEESSAFNTAIAGSRVIVAPGAWLTIGATYISEFDTEPSLSEGFDARQEIYGLDTALILGEALTLTTEYALSRDYLETEENGVLRQAVRAEFIGKLGQRIEIQGNYQLAERGFLTFANPDIDPDEQLLEFTGTYLYYPGHAFTLGYGFWQDNLPRDSESPTKTTQKPYIEWEAVVREHTELYAKYEYIQTADDHNPKEADERTHAFLIGGIQEFMRVPLFKKLLVRAEYQLSDFEDETDQQADSMTHQAGLRLKAEPVQDLTAYMEQRERWIYDKGSKENTERQDISEFDVELKRWEGFSLESKYQYRSSWDLLLDKRESDRHTMIVSSKLIPLSVVTVSSKIEFWDETAYAIDSSEDDASSQSLTFEGRLLFTPKKDLNTRLRYEYRQTEDSTATTTREEDTELRINYTFDKHRMRLTGVIKLERDLLDAPPAPETETRAITYLAGAKRQLTGNWDLLAQYKREEVDLAAENLRNGVLAELGCTIGRFLKFVIGYQYTDFQDHDDSNNDYSAHSGFFKLIGKL